MAVVKIIMMGVCLLPANGAETKCPDGAIEKCVNDEINLLQMTLDEDDEEDNGMEISSNCPQGQMMQVDGTCGGECSPVPVHPGRPQVANSRDTVIDFPDGKIGKTFQIGKVIRGFEVMTASECAMACDYVKCASFAYNPNDKNREGADQMCYLYNKIFRIDEMQTEQKENGWQLYSTGNCSPLRFFASGTCFSNGCKHPRKSQCQKFGKAVGAFFGASGGACGHSACYKAGAGNKGQGGGSIYSWGIAICTKQNYVNSNQLPGACTPKRNCLCDCS